jgi:predicted homoserine dehydrogenase-like protein
VEQLLSGGLSTICWGPSHTLRVGDRLHGEPIKRQYMNYFKMGDGPYYVFYTPYHLPHVQIVDTVARGLFERRHRRPDGARYATSSRLPSDLSAGDSSMASAVSCATAPSTTPTWFAATRCFRWAFEGCKLKRDVPKDQPIRVDDVVSPVVGCATNSPEQDRHRCKSLRSWLVAAEPAGGTS